MNYVDKILSFLITYPLCLDFLPYAIANIVICLDHKLASKIKEGFLFDSCVYNFLIATIESGSITLINWQGSHIRNIAVFS